MNNLDRFTLGYIETMLWCSEEDDDFLDKDYSILDLAPETLARIEKDCADFQEQNAEDLADESPEHAGHNFWLTRNGHGAGFWDGDYEKDKGERLTKSAESFGELWPYVGDDGKIYF